MSLPHREEVGHPNERDASDLGNPSPNSGPSIARSPPSVSEQHAPGRIANTSASFFSGGYERQVVTAGVIVTIQVQLLTSDSTAITTTTRTLLSFGVVLELLGILLAICFVQSYHPDEGRPRQAPSTLARLVSGVPIVLILTGIIGLAAALVVETFKVSLSIAIIMSGCLSIGVILCLLAINGRL